MQHALLCCSAILVEGGRDFYLVYFFRADKSIEDLTVVVSRIVVKKAGGWMGWRGMSIGTKARRV